MKKIILAIVGLSGSGKTVATNYLLTRTNWPKVYLGQAVIDGVTERGLSLNEANEKIVREDLRKQHGMAALAVVNLAKIKNFFTESTVIVESLYSWEEYLVMKKEFGQDFKILAIFASPEIRQTRIAHRPYRPLSEKEFITRDYSQIENLHQAGPIARADYTIVNEGTLALFYNQMDVVLKKIYEG